MSRHSNSWKWQVALNYLSLTHPRVFCAGTIGWEKKDKDSKIVGVNRHISSSIRQIKERSAGANPFRSRERGETLQSPTLERTEKTKREKVSMTQGGLQPLCQVYTARYLSRVFKEVCSSRNAHSSYRASSATPSVRQYFEVC